MLRRCCPRLAARATDSEGSTSLRNEDEGSSCDTRAIYAEAKATIALALPVMLQRVSMWGMLLTDQGILGHLRDPNTGEPTSRYLDGASLALVFIDLTRMIISRALSQTTRMLSATALGAGDAALAAQWLQLSMALCIVAAVPIAALWMLLPYMLPIVSSNPEVIALAATYARISTVWLLPALWIECVQAWLGAHRWLFLPSLVGLLALVTNLALNLLLVFPPNGAHGLGFAGSALATSITRLLQCATLLIAVKLHAMRPRGAALAHLFRTSTLRAALAPARLRIFILGQALAVAFSALFEEVQFALMSMLASQLGAAALATHATLFNTIRLLNMPMEGLQMAGMVQIGRHLGGGHGIAARRSWLVCVGLTCTLGGMQGVLTFTNASRIGRLFTDASDVLAIAAAVAPILGLVQMAVTPVYAAFAALAAMGRPKDILRLYVSTNFWISPAAGYTLAHTLTWGATSPLVGLWYGYLIGYAALGFGAIARVCSRSWQEEADTAQARTAKAKAGAQGPSSLVIAATPATTATTAAAEVMPAVEKEEEQEEAMGPSGVARARAESKESPMADVELQ